MKLLLLIPACGHASFGCIQQTGSAKVIEEEVRR